MLAPRNRKFAALLVRDLSAFSWFWPLIIFHDMRAGKFVLIALGLMMAHAHQYARRISDPLLPWQTYVRVCIAGIGFCAWIALLLVAAVREQSPALWALCSILIPVLLVFGYASLRVKMGKEPLIDPTNTGI
jgi:hypothetical protein